VVEGIPIWAFFCLLGLPLLPFGWAVLLLCWTGLVPLECGLLLGRGKGDEWRRRSGDGFAAGEACLDLSWEVWEQRPVAIEVLTLFIVFRLFARCDGCFGLLLTILMFFASGVLRCCPGCLTHCLRERDVSMSLLADFSS
jgi:hypothetical protein